MKGTARKCLSKESCSLSSEVRLVFPALVCSCWDLSSANARFARDEDTFSYSSRVLITCKKSIFVCMCVELPRYWVQLSILNSILLSNRRRRRCRRLTSYLTSPLLLSFFLLFLSLSFLLLSSHCVSYYYYYHHHYRYSTPLTPFCIHPRPTLIV